VGEGGSGGALALAAADRLIMQRDAIFSVIAPEAAAVILRRDPAQAPALAGHLGLTSAELHRLGIIDAVADATEAGLRAALTDALGAARPGDRLRRFDAATARWLRP
jgi:acetyl-CoA carboxylase alpha subunit